MNLLSIKLLGSLAVAGMVAAGGTAFTATGFTLGNAHATAVLGGTVDQTVVGAALQSVVYKDGAAASITGLVDSIVVTFTTNLPANAIVELSAFNGVTPITNSTGAVTGGGSVYTFTLTTADEADLTSIDVTVSDTP